MKVAAFKTSAQKDGNTAIMIKTVFSELENQNIDTELVQIAGQPIKGCSTWPSIKQAYG